MKRFIMLAIFGVLLVSPLPSEAASARPTITITSPEKGDVADRTGETRITWETENITRPMVAFVEVKFKKRDSRSPSVGSVTGATFSVPVAAGATFGSQIQDWGLNDTVPGTYTVRAQLRECNKKSCDYSPAGKTISKWTKTTTIKVENNDDWSPSISTDTTLEILSPNGGEERRTGYGRSLKVAWEAAEVPKNSIICLTLESKNTGQFYSLSSPCKKAKDGKGSVKADIGFVPEGRYWVRATIAEKAQKGGKDGATSAEDVSDELIYLTND